MTDLERLMIWYAIVTVLYYLTDIFDDSPITHIRIHLPRRSHAPSK